MKTPPRRSGYSLGESTSWKKHHPRWNTLSLPLPPLYGNSSTMAPCGRTRPKTLVHPGSNCYRHPPNQHPRQLSTPHWHQVSHPRQASKDERSVHELNINMREIHLVEAKYCEDTRPGHKLEASRKQHKVLCKRLKAKSYSSHHSSWCGRLYQSLMHLESFQRARPWYTNSQ